jgi:hypothetical protein
MLIGCSAKRASTVMKLATNAITKKQFKTPSDSTSLYFKTALNNTLTETLKNELTKYSIIGIGLDSSTIRENAIAVKLIVITVYVGTNSNNSNNNNNNFPSLSSDLSFNDYGSHKTFLGNIVEVGGSKTSLAQQDIIINFLKEYNLTNKIIVLTTDSEIVNKSTTKRMKIPRIPCFAHVISLIAKKANQELHRGDDVDSKLLKVITMLRKNWKQVQEYAKVIILFLFFKII